MQRFSIMLPSPENLWGFRWQFSIMLNNNSYHGMSPRKLDGDWRILKCCIFLGMTFVEI